MSKQNTVVRNGVEYFTEPFQESYSVKDCVSTDEKIIIESEINGKPVTAIGIEAFGQNHTLKEIVLPDTIIKLEEKIKLINIPTSVSIIGHYCFYGCVCLEEITLPENVLTINKYTFAKCSSMKKITLLSNINSIKENAFEDCISLSEIIFPETLTKINEFAFRNCQSLQVVDFPQSVDSIGVSAFEKCKNIERVYIPSNIQEIKRDAFRGCSSIKYVIFDSKLVKRHDADKIFSQLFDSGLHTREILLRIPTSISPCVSNNP